jgi:large subunit ribosomal protein L32
MAVQKSRRTRSTRGMRRSHDGLDKASLSIDTKTGETHLRHHITPRGVYRGKQIIESKARSSVQAG